MTDLGVFFGGKPGFFARLIGPRSTASGENRLTDARVSQLATQFFAAWLVSHEEPAPSGFPQSRGFRPGFSLVGEGVPI